MTREMIAARCKSGLTQEVGGRVDGDDQKRCFPP